MEGFSTIMHTMNEFVDGRTDVLDFLVSHIGDILSGNAGHDQIASRFMLLAGILGAL